MKHLILASCWLACTACAQAQQPGGKLRLQESIEVTRLMERFEKYNLANPEVTGWTVLLFSTTDRRKLEDERQLFANRYPDVPCDWTHAKPYYKLKAGAFKTKLEALRLIQQLKTYYPAAYPAKDVVKVADMVRS